MSRLQMAYTFALMLAASAAEIPAALAADRPSVGWQQTQTKKAESRWTLEGWLDQKRQMRLMDLWLSQNTQPSAWELFLGGGYGDLETLASFWDAELGVYFYRIGLFGHFGSMSGDQDIQAAFHLRLIGDAEQGTHLMFHYGLRELVMAPENAGSEMIFRQPFYGARLSLYLTRRFGILGEYHTFLPSAAAQGERLSSESSNAGLFFDFNGVWIAGSWLSEGRTFTGGTTPSLRTTGWRAGLRFYY